jgi:hypothetical protein
MLPGDKTMNSPALLLIITALLLVGVLVYRQFRTVKPPAGAQLLADLWRKLPREQKQDASTTQQPSSQTAKPPRRAAASPARSTGSR